MLYFLCGALYSFTWYRQAERMALPAWRYCLQIIMAFTGWPWLAITEWNMQECLDRYMDAHVAGMQEEMGLEQNAYERGYDEAVQDLKGSGSGHMTLTCEQSVMFTKAMEDILGHQLDGSPLPEDRQQIPTATVWFTGLSGAGKSTLAERVQLELCTETRENYTLDGDVLREGLCKDLGFSEEDRMENLRRAAEVAKLMNERDYIVLAAFISPTEACRKVVREILGDSMILVHLSTPLDVCEERDPKGLYKKARSGEIPNFTGIGQEYEVPEDVDLVIDTSKGSIEDCAGEIVKKLKARSLTTTEETSE